MTTVGKILVFLNLLFSLAVGALAVVDFTARTHWAKGFEDLKATNEVLVNGRNLYKAESDKERAAMQKWDEDLARQGTNKESVLKDLTRANARVDALEKQGEAQRGQLVAANTARIKLEIAVQTAQKLEERRQADFEKTRELLQKETNANTQLIKDMNDWRDKATGAIIERNSAVFRANEMEREVARLATEVVRVKAGLGGVAGGGRGAPPSNVEGLVKRTDSSGYVTITIGSDAGVAKGQKLQVFRLTGGPRYLGSIQIVSVEHKQSVGQVVGKMSAPVREGDRVAYRVLP